MIRIEMQLPPEQANVVWEAMNAALDAGRRDDVSAETPSPTTAREGVAPAVLQTERADALVSVEWDIRKALQILP
jgi:hypothetical protein